MYPKREIIIEPRFILNGVYYYNFRIYDAQDNTIISEGVLDRSEAKALLSANAHNFTSYPKELRDVK